MDTYNYWTITNPYSDFTATDMGKYLYRSQALETASKAVLKEGFGATRFITWQDDLLEYMVICVGIDLFNMVEFTTRISLKTFHYYQLLKKGE